MTATIAVQSGIERVFRDVYGQAVATLVRVFGERDVAEDAVQDAFVVASERWRSDGIPPNPAGWINDRTKSCDRCAALFSAEPRAL